MVPNLNEYTDVVAEKALIAYLLKNQEVDDITSRCQPDFFSHDFLRRVFELCVDYITGVGKGVVDRQSIISILEDQGEYEEVRETINKIYGFDTQSVGAKDYLIQKIETLRIRRSLISRLYRGLEKAQDKDADIHKLIADIEEDVVTIDQCGRGKLELVTPSKLVDRRKQGLEDRYISKGIYTGWGEFDKFLSTGFCPGKLSITAGRTSMGKSLWKSNMIIQMCNQGVGVLNICPEQGFDSEHDRLDSIKTRIHLKTISRLRELPLGDPKFELLRQSSQEIADKWQYVCVPTRTITVAGVRSAIRRSRRNGVRIDVVTIDLFDRLQDVNVSENRTGNISVKLGQIAQIAQEEQVHMNLLVQINRAPESRKDKRPTLGDLRDCGSYEMDADMIFLLYREGYYNKDIEDNLMEVNIAKQRDGAMNIIYEFCITDKQTLHIASIGEKRAANTMLAGG